MTAHPRGPASPSAAAQPRSGRIAQAATAITVLCLAGVLGLHGRAVAAPGNQLTDGTVSPASGTTNTTFTFAVSYQSAQGNEPTSVSALAGNVVVPLSLVSGSPADGRYRGTAKLPQGSWQVIYQATARGNDPTLSGPTVSVSQVSPPPTPTPKPTPRPTPRPTPPPTPKPSPKPTAKPTPGLTAAATATSQPSSAPQTTEPRTPTPATHTPGRSPLATPRATQSDVAGAGVRTPAASPDGERPGLGGANIGPSPLVTVVVGTLLALAVLGLIGLFAFIAGRRRRHPDRRLELLPEEARQAPADAVEGSATPSPARTPTNWERDWALDEAPIGSVEYRPPPADPLPEDEGA